jgi:hypothetical protein
MARYIIAIRRPNHPECYYLSWRGLRCYEPKNVAVFHTAEAAQKEIEYFAKEMPSFQFSIERLPPRVNLSIGLLRAVPV